MDLMRQYGIPIPQGRVATTAAEAQDIATEMLLGRRGG
jgi:succinyl-CoA synthetase beta subunit